MNPATDMSRRLLACLSDTSRYRIVRLLRDDERCVTEIARAVGLSQSCTTRHLQALTRGQVVRRRRAGKRVLFRLDDREPAVRDLLTWLGAVPGTQSAGQGRRSAGRGEEMANDPGARAAPRSQRNQSGGAARAVLAETRGQRRSGDGAGAAGEARVEEGPDSEGGGDSRERARHEEAAGGGGKDAAQPERPEGSPPQLRPGDLEDYLL